MAALITVPFDGTPEEAAAALRHAGDFILAESGNGLARELASAFDGATVDVPRPWYCASCGTEHDGAELVVAVYGCGRYSIGTLHRAAASIARELTASLREGA